MLRARSVRVLLGGALLASAAMGCATYTNDLERARRHYQGNQYENALALFRVLERDMDSLSPTERVQYAYLRGMTDYRLASTATAGTGVKNPKAAFRQHARHWLGLSAAMEKDVSGSLNDDEKERLGKALEDLNQEVFGGAEDKEKDEAAQGEGSSWETGQPAAGDAPKDEKPPVEAPEGSKPPVDEGSQPDNGI